MKARRIIFTLAALLFSLSALANTANCPTVSEDHLTAQYDMTRYTRKLFAKQVTRTPLELIRIGQNQTIYHYPKARITDIWHKDPDGEVRLIKAFLSPQRAIEYEPLEVAMLVKQRWQKLRHLIAPSALNALTLKSTEETDCFTTQRYQGRIGKAMVNVVWAKQLNLPLSLSWQDNQKKTTYTLTSLAPAKTDLVADISDFDSTDFADIGDNESDPFLANMITLGFIHHSHKIGHTHPPLN